MSRPRGYNGGLSPPPPRPSMHDEHGHKPLLSPVGLYSGFCFFFVRVICLCCRPILGRIRVVHYSRYMRTAVDAFPRGPGVNVGRSINHQSSGVARAAFACGKRGEKATLRLFKTFFIVVFPPHFARAPAVHEFFNAGTALGTLGRGSIGSIITTTCTTSDKGPCQRGKMFFGKSKRVHFVMPGIKF